MFTLKDRKTVIANGKQSGGGMDEQGMTYAKQ
ncbi:MAG: hypothetical protein UZ07_CHB004003241 [Chlorobi bacterium OLB7]|nr:MAG: hypothetical protein UZ07_CHB004003241 [Chlorobi bacterium OLB7]